MKLLVVCLSTPVGTLSFQKAAAAAAATYLLEPFVAVIFFKKMLDLHMP